MTSSVSKIRPAIEIENLDYSYRGHWLIGKKNILKGITLKVFSGESFGFLGHNGAGKTTTIKAMLGIAKVRRGTISIFSINHRDAKARSLIGYLPEHPYFYDHLTVEEILTMYASLSNIPRTRIPDARKRALALVKLSERGKAPLRSLSKGLMQRVGMAQAIIAQPRLLVLDEPFSGLDPIGRKDFKELLVHLKGEGTTIFMSSHILSDVEFLCDRVSIMSKGEIKGIFNVRDIPSLSMPRFELAVEESEKSKAKLVPLMSQPRVENGKIVGTFANRQLADGALKTALESNIRVDSFSTVQDSLEDVFVKLVQFDEAKGT